MARFQSSTTLNITIDVPVQSNLGFVFILKFFFYCISLSLSTFQHTGLDQLRLLIIPCDTNKIFLSSLFNKRSKSRNEVQYYTDDIVFLLGTLHWRCRRRAISIVTSHYSPSLSGTVVMSRDWLGWKWERPRNKTLVNDTIAYYRRNKGLDHFFVLTWSGKWEQSDFPVSNDRCFFKY